MSAQITSLYASMPDRLARARAAFGRPLTLSEKILVAHSDDFGRNWVVPEEPGEKSVAQPPTAPPAPADPEPISAIRVIRWTLGVIAVAAFAYGPVEVKAGVMGLAAIALLVWSWTAFDY